MGLDPKIVARILEDDDWLRYQFDELPRGATTTAERSGAEGLRHLAKSWFDKLQDDSECRAAPYLRELGVNIAGFIYLDEPQHQVEITFFEPATGDRSAEYMVPYIWGEDKKGEDEKADADWRRQASELIDQYFLLTRNSQNPWSDDPASVPEWALDLPYCSLDPRRLASAATATHDNPEPYRRELEVRTRFGIHYCPWGEVLFYCLAWRWLVRSTIAGSDGGEASTCCGEVSEEALWQPSLWPIEKSAAGALPEHRLSRWISGEDDLELVDSISKDRGLIKFKLDWLRKLKPKAGKSWEDDWLALGITDAAHWAPLLAYLAATRVASGPASDFSAVRESVRAATTALFGSGLDGLREVHRTARFPVIAYFYWNALEPLRNKTHLVVPLWRSPQGTSSSLLSQYPKIADRLRRHYPGDTCGDLAAEGSPGTPQDFPFGFGKVGMARPEFSHVSACAVVGLKPDPWADWTLDDAAKKESSPTELTRVIRMLRNVSQPLVERVYFDKLRLAAIRRDERNVVADAAQHEVRRTLAAMRGRFMLNPDPSLISSGVIGFAPDWKVVPIPRVYDAFVRTLGLSWATTAAPVFRALKPGERVGLPSSLQGLLVECYELAVARLVPPAALDVDFEDANGRSQFLTQEVAALDRLVAASSSIKIEGEGVEAVDKWLGNAASEESKGAGGPSTTAALNLTRSLVALVFNSIAHGNLEQLPVVKCSCRNSRATISIACEPRDPNYRGEFKWIGKLASQKTLDIGRGLRGQDAAKFYMSQLPGGEARFSDATPGLHISMCEWNLT